MDNGDLVGKKGRVEIYQATYEEPVLKQDTDVTAAKVGSKIDALRISFREALGLKNRTGAGTTLDGTTLRGGQLEKCRGIDDQLLRAMQQTGFPEPEHRSKCLIRIHIGRRSQLDVDV